MKPVNKMAKKLGSVNGKIREYVSSGDEDEDLDEVELDDEGR